MTPDTSTSRSQSERIQVYCPHPNGTQHQIPYLMPHTIVIRFTLVIIRFSSHEVLHVT